MPDFRQLRPFARSLFSALLLALLLAGTLVACSIPHNPDYCNVAPANVDPHLLAQDGSVYLQAASADSLYALSSENGAVLWKYHAFLNEYERGMSTARLVTNDVLYISVAQRGLDALRASDGKLLWRQQNLQSDLQLFAVAGGALYAYSPSAQRLEAIQSGDGSLLWAQPLAYQPLEFQAANDLVFLYASSFNGSEQYVITLRASDGTMAWQFSAEGAYYPSANHMVVANGAVYVSLDKLYTLRASDGSLLWNTPGAPLGWILDQGVIYLSTAAPQASSLQVTALRASDGSLLWSSRANQMAAQTLLIAGGVLYLSDQGYTPNGSTVFNDGYIIQSITALRASDGSSLWGYALGNNDTAAYPSADALYLLSQNGLDALRASDGTLLWHHSTAASGMAIASDGLYLGAGGVADGSPCHQQGPSSLEKLRASDVASLWHIEEAAVTKPSL